jgi:O-succinylbenzoate synthase
MDIELRPFRVPLRARFRGLDERAGLLVRRGETWAEFSPFDDYTPAQQRRWAAATFEALDGDWPQPLRDSVPVNVTVPAVGPEEAHSLVVASGCTTAKVKIGDDGDEARLEAVRDALGPQGKLRVDVNAAWDEDLAARKLGQFKRFDLEYVEQPVADLDAMRSLRRKVDVPLAIDESLRTADDPFTVDIRDAADVAVLKVAPLGGVRSTLELANHLGIPVVISSALESSVGMAAGIACAAALDELPYACGLATTSLFEADLVDDPLVPVDGHIEVRIPTVDQVALERFADEGPDADRLRAWFQEVRS